MSYDPLSFGDFPQQDTQDTLIYQPADDRVEGWSNEELLSPRKVLAGAEPANTPSSSAYYSTAGSTLLGSNIDGNVADPLLRSRWGNAAPRPGSLPNLLRFATVDAPQVMLTFTQPSQQNAGVNDNREAQRPGPPGSTMLSPVTNSQLSQQLPSAEAMHSVLVVRPFATHSTEPPRLAVVVQTPQTLRGPSGLPGIEEAYMAYKVTYQTSLPAYANSQATVVRRFRDFVSLSDTLHTLYPGYFIPPRPSRNAIEGRRMKPQFLEARRAALEQYLNRLAAHPTLGQSDALQLFLETPSDLRQHPSWHRLQPPSPSMGRSTARLLLQLVGQERTVPTPRDAQLPARASRDLYRMLHEQVAALQGANHRSQVSGSELLLRDESHKLEERMKALATLTARADSWLSYGAERQTVTEELGTALARLAAYEEVSGYSPGAARTETAMAEGVLKIAKLMSFTRNHAAKHLAYLNDTLAYLPAIHVALQHRHRTLLTSLTLEMDLYRRREALQKASVASNISYIKLEALRHEVGQLEVTVESARSEYSRVLERNSEELASFKAQSRRGMGTLLKEFALVQIASAQKANSMWTELAQSLAAC